MKGFKIPLIIGFIIALVFFANRAGALASTNELINTKSFDNAHPWVVLPGTRLAAGSPGQNEFYILGKSEAPMKVNLSKKEVPQKVNVVNRKEITHIKLALRKSFHHAMLSKRSKHHKVARNKINARTRIGLNHKHHLSG